MKPKTKQTRQTLLPRPKTTKENQIIKNIRKLCRSDKNTI